ncbi:MAG: hypothetical protein KJO08_03650 [Gammaproteobacteria bacterium]|nr:hypothetical protein [Gammaproteobacteria bacterium]
MSDYILVEGDMVTFLPPFGAAIVTPLPGTLAGTGYPIGGKKAALEGDEADVQVPGCPYIAPPYVVPGTGTLKIEALDAKQLTEKTTYGGKKLILKGSNFKAVFEVQAPAAQPPPAGGAPDSTTKYSGGQGMFINTNLTVKGT